MFLIIITFCFQISGATDTVTNPIPTHHTNTFKCDTHDGYMDLERDGTHLCVKIVTHQRNWDSARSDCKHNGGDLVVLDTSVKARMMRMKLVHDGHCKLKMLTIVHSVQEDLLHTYKIC
jgi:hypothetical protein